MLLTNDGALCPHARTAGDRVATALSRARARPHAQADLDQLQHGITLDGVRYGAIEAHLERQQRSNVWLTFAMREGKNREVRDVLGHLGLAVNRLIRVSFGPFQLADLPAGAVEKSPPRLARSAWRAGHCAPGKGFLRTGYRRDGEERRRYASPS